MHIADVQTRTVSQEVQCNAALFLVLCCVLAWVSAKIPKYFDAPTSAAFQHAVHHLDAPCPVSSQEEKERAPIPGRQRTAHTTAPVTADAVVNPRTAPGRSAPLLRVVWCPQVGGPSPHSFCPGHA